MKTIRINAEAHTALMAQAEDAWDPGLRRNPDGSWDVLVDEQMLTALDSVKLPGETYSDTIIRLAHTQPKDGSTRRSYQ
jgi:hypothetical protein